MNVPGISSRIFRQITSIIVSFRQGCLNESG
jgi:hypothetical protein